MVKFQTTKKWKNWWENRKADWKTSYLDTYNHPHRAVIVGILKQLPWVSLIEVGCNAGPNLVKIIKEIPNRQIGGIDINPEAIELANKIFTGALFKVCPADDIMLSDKATDVILSDMVYIYVSPRDIDRYICELKRVSRKYIVLCEFSVNNWLQQFLIRIKTGYFAHNWHKILEKHGFYDIIFVKLKPEDWPGGGLQDKIGYIIVAKVGY